MYHLINELENGIIGMEEVTKAAEKEADRLQGMISKYELDGGKVEGRGKYCARLEGYVWSEILSRFVTFYPYYEDLFQAAMLSILEQEENYDPLKGELTTFFHPYIMHGICTWINTNITFSTQHYSVMEKKINDFLRSIGKDIMEVPTAYVVRETGMSPKTVENIRVLKQMRRASRIDLVAETSFAESNIKSIYYSTPEEYYLAVEEKKEILERIDLLRNGMYNGCTLSDEQARMVRDYYVLDGNVPKKMSKIARDMGIPYHTVKKELSASFRKLRWEVTKGTKGKAGLKKVNEKGEK